MSHDDDSRPPGGGRAGDERGRRRKEKVLHARISDSLDEEIRDRAERLGISVSNLVRNVLENTLGVVDDIVADTSRVARSARDAVRTEPRPRAPEPTAPSAPAVDEEPVTLGWQEFVLSLNAVCDDCNSILPKGTRAAASVSDRHGARRRILCLACAGIEA